MLHVSRIYQPDAGGGTVRLYTLQRHSWPISLTHSLTHSLCRARYWPHDTHSPALVVARCDTQSAIEASVTLHHRALQAREQYNRCLDRRSKPVHVLASMLQSTRPTARWHSTTPKAQGVQRTHYSGASILCRACVCGNAMSVNVSITSSDVSATYFVKRSEKLGLSAIPTPLRNAGNKCN
jgi:hypothetical protein